MHGFSAASAVKNSGVCVNPQPPLNKLRPDVYHQAQQMSESHLIGLSPGGRGRISDEFQHPVLVRHKSHLS